MKQRIFSLLSIVLLILTLLPGSAMALAEGEQGHNHADGYCYVCGQGDPSYARSYNVAQYTEDGSGVVVIGETDRKSVV